MELRNKEFIYANINKKMDQDFAAELAEKIQSLSVADNIDCVSAIAIADNARAKAKMDPLTAEEALTIVDARMGGFPVFSTSYKSDLRLPLVLTSPGKLISEYNKLVMLANDSEDIKKKFAFILGEESKSLGLRAAELEDRNNPDQEDFGTNIDFEKGQYGRYNRFNKEVNKIINEVHQMDNVGQRQGAGALNAIYGKEFEPEQESAE